MIHWIQVRERACLSSAHMNVTANDVGRSSYGMARVQQAFAYAFDVLANSVLHTVQDGRG
jgi:DNA polymerase sigma